MKINHFFDFKGRLQTQYDAESFDHNKEILALIGYPNKIVLLIQVGMWFEQLDYNMDELLHDSHRFRLLSLVNYDDLKYTSIVAERRLS